MSFILPAKKHKKKKVSYVINEADEKKQILYKHHNWKLDFCTVAITFHMCNNLVLYMYVLYRPSSTIFYKCFLTYDTNKDCFQFSCICVMTIKISLSSTLPIEF